MSGPLSEVLLREKPWLGEAVAGYGSGNGELIDFTGGGVLCFRGELGYEEGWLDMGEILEVDVKII